LPRRRRAIPLGPAAALREHAALVVTGVPIQPTPIKTTLALSSRSVTRRWRETVHIGACFNYPLTDR
jgi:hypothetical protein